MGMIQGFYKKVNTASFMGYEAQKMLNYQLLMRELTTTVRQRRRA